MEPSKGEVAALVGFGGQFELAARIVLAKLATLEWIRVADPNAGIADDFQFQSGGRRHALQVKWSQVPGAFTWSDLTAGEKSQQGRPAKPGLFTQLATAWQRLRTTTAGPLTIYLCSNDIASNSPASRSTPLGMASASVPHTLARFVIHGIAPVREAISNGCTLWSELVALPAVVDWNPVWEALREMAPLTDEEFVGFIGALELRFGVQAVDPLLLPDQDGVDDDDVEHLRVTLWDIVREPERPEQLSRDELLKRLGWTHRLAYRHPHRFPIPAVYTANNAARSALEQRITEFGSGYLALIGPAGSGKSTLLASMKLPGTVVYYYAFVPDSPNPLSSRGEAESYLHDVSLALETSGLGRRGIANDLHSRRAVLLDQLDQAGRRWTQQREPTILIIDGLDHVPREQSPTRSFIEELPTPAALPDGVFVVLGTQSVAMLRPEIRAVLEQPDRTVVVPPLSVQESRQLIELSGVGSWLYDNQIEKAVEAGEGHPLALTYLLQDLAALQEHDPNLQSRRESAWVLLRGASDYGGDIQARYRGYFLSVGSNPEVRDLLGMVARLRVPINPAWLATWTDPAVVATFTETTAAYFRQSGDDLQFIHNSFRLFLAEETARVGPLVSPDTDRYFHQRLAEVCADARDEWRLYGEEEIAHRYLAQQHDRVLTLATPDELLQSLVNNLRPLETVRDHAMLGMRSAISIDDAPTLVSLLIFLNEIWVRDYVLETAELAKTILLSDRRIALDHIVRANTLRVEPAEAVRLAVEFATVGGIDAAQQIVRACGGIAGLLDTARRSDTAIADWAKVTWLLSGTDAVLAELDHHLPAKPATDKADTTADVSDDRFSDDGEEEDRAYGRNVVHMVCLHRAVESRDELEIDRLIAMIDSEAGPSWRASARLRKAQAASDDQISERVLQLVGEIAAIDVEDASEGDDDDEIVTEEVSRHAVGLGIRIACAELLVRHGYSDRSELDALVPPGTVPAGPARSYTREEGLSAYDTWIALYRLRRMKRDPAPEQSVSPIDETDDPYRERLRQALKVLADLEGQQRLAELGLDVPPSVAAMARPIIRLCELSPGHDQNFMALSELSSVFRDLQARVIKVAAESGGYDGLMRLLAEYDAAWTDRVRRSFWSPEQRQAVITAALNTDPESRPWAVEWLSGLDIEIDALHDEPYSRATRYLGQARAWAAAQEHDAALRCVQQAVRASISLGASDHDQQLIEWVDWLAEATTSGLLEPIEFDSAACRYAERLAAAATVAGLQASDAAERLLELTFAQHPALGSELAEWLCNAGVLSEAKMIEVITATACRHPEIPVADAAAVAARLLYPIATERPARIEEAVESREDLDGSAMQTLRDAAALCPIPLPVHDPDPASSEVIPLRTPRVESDQPQINSIGSLLTLMRTADSITDTAPMGGWDETVQRLASTGTVPLATVRALIEHATRVGLHGPALGTLIALAARSGDVGVAERTLTDELSSTGGWGWLRHADGGSRLALFGAALVDRCPELVRLARHDVANSLASGSLSGNLSPEDIRRIITVVAGADLIAAAWLQVESHLDRIITLPIDRIENPIDFTTVTTTHPVVVLARWVTRFLGHPIRPVDFGARRALQTLHHRHRESVQPALAEAIDTGGWRGESALLSLITTRPDEHVSELSVALTEAVGRAAVGSDGICRDLAANIGHIYGIRLPRPSAQALPTAYNLVLPTPAARTLPELDHRGVPYLDLHDPRQLVAPFDQALELLAHWSSLPVSALLYRAARVAASSSDRWIAAGHQGQAELLNARQQRLGYRPWAYMAGRRGLATVLAELADAGLLDNIPFPRSHHLGLIDERLVGIEPDSWPDTMPLPWIAETSPVRDFRRWCAETGQATEQYIDDYLNSGHYILAERGSWRILDLGLPEEDRSLYTLHDSSSWPLLRPRARPWELNFDGAQRYPESPDLEWSWEELVVHGHEHSSDAVEMTWLALHPAVGERLGWRHDTRKLFTWTGHDGRWRARSLLFAQGDLTHTSHRDVASTHTWQVQLSDAGYSELVGVWPVLRRELQVDRRLPPNRRDGRPDEQRGTSRVILADR
ncbi:hypothetical protein ACFTS5_02195 [Nocardia sp. NPDC056952]|uniref:hypothetical protein n=1 Tax=Nocardia sp. NPDC056952 TaxID=3345979 RepID=UPI003631B808